MNLKSAVIATALRLLNVTCLLAILYFFVLSFIYPYSGSVFIIYGSCVLLFLALLLLMAFFLDKSQHFHSLMLTRTLKFIVGTLRYALLPSAILAVFVSIGFAFVTATNYYFLNMGCYIAFIMIIILEELVYKILLPIAGVKNTI